MKRLRQSRREGGRQWLCRLPSPENRIDTGLSRAPARGSDHSRRHSVSSRKEDVEDRAALVVRRDGAAVTLDNGPDDRKAEPAAAGGLARGVNLVEAIEDQWQMLGRNAVSA